MLKVAQVLHFSPQTQKGRDKRILIDEIKKTVVHPNKGGHESALERWLTWLSCARGSTHEKLGIWLQLRTGGGLPLGRLLGGSYGLAPD